MMGANNSDSRSAQPAAAGDEPSLADRFRGAVWGQFVGDAACLGSHWIYNLTELESTFPGGIRGFEAPGRGHYHFGKEPGDQTHYGEAALLLLASVDKLRRFDPVDFGRRFVARMDSADYTGYRDSATRGTLENYQVFREEHPDTSYAFQEGADDDQLATASRLAPVLVGHCFDPHLLEVVAAATRVCQNNPRAVAYMKCHALILLELFKGRDVHTAFHRVEETIAGEPGYGKEIRRKIQAAIQAKHLSVRDATLQFGQSCPLICSFPSAVHAAIKYPENFSRAILETVRSGGDSAGRATLIGTWLGAALGLQGIPESWRTRLTARSEIQQQVERLIAHVLPPGKASAEASPPHATAVTRAGGVAPARVRPESARIPLTKSFDAGRYRIPGTVSGELGTAERRLSLCRSIGRDILKLREGFNRLSGTEGLADGYGALFDFFGFREKAPFIIKLTGAFNRFNNPGRNRIHRLSGYRSKIPGLNVALLQLRLDRGEYRLWVNEALLALAGGPGGGGDPVEQWIRARMPPSGV